MRKVIPLVVLLCAFAWASEAVASQVIVTKAEANADWTAASFEGEIHWTDCSTGACKWTPYLFVVPTTDSCSASLLSNQGNGKFIWSGPTRTTTGIFPFEVNDRAIIRGLAGQKTCFVATYLKSRRDIFCEFDNPPSSCPPVVDEWASSFAGSKALTEAKPDPDPKPTMTAAEAKILAKGKLAKKYGRSWNKGRKRKVACREFSTIFNCKATWKFKAKKRKGSVTVRK